MNLANKLFKNNKTGDLIRVIDSFENIAILENKQKLDVRELLNPSLYTEQIDVKNFFNNQNAYNDLAQKIKNIPTTHMKDESEPNTVRIDMGSGPTQLPSAEESAVILSDPEQEKLELARKYGATFDNSSVQKQNEAFSKILGDDEDLPKTEVRINNQPHVEVNREYQQPQVQRISVDDPITQMFRNVKRNVSFKMSIEISNKIPRLDFIEMMEDSYEISIIDFLAEEFTQNILNNPDQIKEMVKDKIKKIVYGTGITKEEPKEEPKNEVTNEEPKKKPAVKKARATKKETSK